MWKKSLINQDAEMLVAVKNNKKELLKIARGFKRFSAIVAFVSHVTAVRQCFYVNTYYKENFGFVVTVALMSLANGKIN